MVDGGGYLAVGCLALALASCALQFIMLQKQDVINTKEEDSKVRACLIAGV